MNIQLPPAVTRKGARLLLLAQKNSPELLFATGVVGVVGTVVLACKATLKVDEVLADAEKKMANVDLVVHKGMNGYEARDAKRDVTIIRAQTAGQLVRLYAPAVIVGIGSVAALTGAHNIQKNRLAATMAAYTALEKGFEQYRKRVIEELGEDKDREFRFGGQKKTVIEETTKGKKETKVFAPDLHAGGGKSIYARVFDKTNKHWKPQAQVNKTFLQIQQTYANDRLKNYGHVFLNEVYDMLGFPRTKEGSVVGWVWDKHPNAKDGFIDFGLFENGNMDIRDTFDGSEGWWLDFNVDGLIFDIIDELS